MIVNVCSQCVETVIVTVIISGSSRFSGHWKGSTEKINQFINETEHLHLVKIRLFFAERTEGREETGQFFEALFFFSL